MNDRQKEVYELLGRMVDTPPNRVQEVGDLVRKITDESPIRKWRKREDPPLGKERKYVREIPLEWWEELCYLLGIDP